MQDGLNIAILIITVIAAVLGFLQWRASRKKKRLKVVVSPVKPIEKMDEKEKLKFLCAYEGEKLKNLSVVRILVRNSGNVVLEDKDFVEKIGVFLGKESTFLNFNPLTVRN